MTVQKVESHIDAIERKLTKSLKIAEKGNSMKLGDVIKLGTKTNSIVSELKKGVSEYDVSGPDTALDRDHTRVKLINI